MKAILTIFLVVFLIQNTKAQKIDMINAPKNPIGFKWKKVHFNLRGDIYASAGKIFDRNGNLQYNFGTRYYYDNSGKIIGDNYNDKFNYDSRGNITLFQYNSGTKTEYNFNDKDLLVYEKNSYCEEKSHLYDNKNRIVKSTIKKKGKLDHERFYSYSAKGDSVIVEMNYVYATGRSNFEAKSFYLNGFLVKEELRSGTYRYIVETDNKGNKIDFYSAHKKDVKHYETFNRYYSDANIPQNIEFGYHKPYSNSKKTETVFVNGKRAKDIAISKGVKPNEKVIYDGLTKTYYSISNVIPENHTINTRIPVSNVLLIGEPHINYAYDGKFINYIHGYNRVKSRDFAFIGPHMIDYRVDKNSSITYIIENYKNIKDQNVKVIREFTRIEPSIVYNRDLPNENFFILENGKHIDYKKARFEYLPNGDPVIFINNVPRYVLTGFRTAENQKVYTGKIYENELEKDKTISTHSTSNLNNKITSQVINPTEINSNYNCIDGDCKEGWGKVKIGDILTEATFKNGALNGVAYITYPNDSYYHGEYVDNRREGIGFYQWSSGNKYIGEWKNGKQHGYGYTLDKNNKVTSAGIFENGTIKTYLDAKYLKNTKAGNCLGDCTDGFGQFLYNNGDIYLGFFKNGKRTKVGFYTWANKSSYIGRWVIDNGRHGYGKYTYVDGSVFKGMFNKNLIDGLGVMKYTKSGNLMRGVFNNKGAKVKDF